MENTSVEFSQQLTERERNVIKLISNGGTYAHVLWTPQDVLTDAEGRGFEFTTEQAEQVISSAERDICDAMIRAGWDVIGMAVLDQAQK